MMRVVKGTNYFLVALSCMLALFLTIMPMPQSIVWLRPQWMLMVLLFWVITSPSQCGITLAWSMGILTDLVCGTPVGQQALIFVVLTYIVMKCHAIIAHSPPWQQAMMIAVFAGLGIFLQSIILGFMGHSPHVTQNGLSVFTTLLIWPFLYSFLDLWRPREYL